MIWWWRNRGYTMHFSVVVGTLVAVLLVGDAAFPVPSLLGGSSLRLPVMLLLPLAPSSVASYCLSRRDGLELTGTQPTRWLDCAVMVMTAAIGMLAGTLLQVTGLNDQGFAAGRNMAGYIGLSLVGVAIVGAQASSLFPVTVAVVTSSLGAQVNGQARSWAWPAAGAESLLALVVALATLVLGLLCGLVWGGRAGR
ncbi:hypothetical protein CcI49_10400 [Frankia sp. CcI49]|nr:hypothetical protein CcI49_10400 [Frankia sp. CcI49]